MFIRIQNELPHHSQWEILSNIVDLELLRITVFVHVDLESLCNRYHNKMEVKHVKDT